MNSSSVRVLKFRTTYTHAFHSKERESANEVIKSTSVLWALVLKKDSESAGENKKAKEHLINVDSVLLCQTPTRPIRGGGG